MNPRAYSIDEFRLTDVEKKGGMSKVLQAQLLEANEMCALKYPAIDSISDFAIESHNREVGALQDMDHENIVRMLGIGVDGINRFIVLEWLQETLVDRIQSMGPSNWTTFYEMIGRPLLKGILYAHSRRYVHRDLKPWNVMFNRMGVPKITDFGIARDMDRNRSGKTFAQSGSHPWTPAEADDGIKSENRDLYSWAALCIACLTGRFDFKLTSELRDAAAQLGDLVPQSLLEKCLSELPAIRPLSATALIWDLDDFHRNRQGKSDVLRTMGVDVSQKVHKLLIEFMPDEDDIDKRIQRLFGDFLETCEIFIDDEEYEFRGKMYCLKCVRQSAESPWLVIKDAIPGQLNSNPRLGFRSPMQFVERTNPNADATKSRANIAFLEGFLKSYSDREAQEQKRRDEERYLTMLQDIVAWRMRALRDLPALDYFDGKWVGGEFAVSIRGHHIPVNGEQRIIRTASGLQVFEVVRVALERVFLRPIGFRRGQLMAEGKLQIDTVAQRRALERQDDAVKTLGANLAVSPSLKRIILNPKDAEVPESGGRPPIDGLSPDKVHVLEAALGLRQLMVVRGPPGTGKTRLITEVVKRYFVENPDGRVLIAAQTHIAIDHVIEKLLENDETANRIVRIARADDDKVSAMVKDALLHNCLLRWCREAAESSRQFVKSRGALLGLDAAEVELSIRLESLVLACERGSKIDALLELETRQLEQVQLEAGVDQSPTQDSQFENATIAVMTVSELESEKRTLTENIQHLRDELRTSGSDGVELADLTVDALREWNGVFKNEDPKWCEFRKEIELQVAWLGLLGQLKQFEEVVLRSASVVAGTCVGLGSSEAFTKTKFDLCIIDEASKATATEALVPMVRSHRCLVVGDPIQLPPFEGNFIDVDGYTDGEVRETMLDYLIPRLPKDCVFELTHQHRMCKSIGELISYSFYQRKLVNERPDNDRPNWIRSNFPKPVVWMNTSGKSQTPQGNSYINRFEQDKILDLLATLQAAAKKSQNTASVAIIAGYAAQARALDSRIQRGSLTELSIEVATVDSFQGRESDICIFSVTLSNTDDYLGFLRSLERLNVALSRPRDLLVIVGDQDFCYGVPGKNPFVEVIDFIETHPESCETKHVSH
jgi:hypothetical protein